MLAELGFLDSLERRPLLAIFHSYSDESGKKGDHSVTTFSCLVLQYEKLASFDADWRQLLRVIGAEHLHMKKASRLNENYGILQRKQTYAQRIDALKPFADCINRYFELGTMMAIEVAAFNSMSPLAKKAVALQGKADDPYYLCFVRSIMNVLRYIQQDDRLCVVCDDDVETSQNCHGFYLGMRKVRHWPETQKMICMSFADDKYFPALQAADMLAFLFRFESRRVIYREHYDWVPLFNQLAKPRGAGYTNWLELIGDKPTLERLSGALENTGHSKGRR